MGKVGNTLHDFHSRESVFTNDSKRSETHPTEEEKGKKKRNKQIYKTRCGGF